MMSIKNFYDNDIYVMKRVGDTIVINNNYEGVLILDSELNVVKEEELSDDLVVRDCFINQDTKEIIIHDCENHYFAYLDTISSIKKIIPIPDEFKDLLFRLLYEWKADKPVLLAYTGERLRIEVLEGVVKKDSGSISPAICGEEDFLSKHIVSKIDPYENIAVTEQGKEIKIVNLQTGQARGTYPKYNDRVNDVDVGKDFIYYSSIGDSFHDVEVSKDFVALISEREIKIYDHEKCILNLSPFDKFYFLMGVFLIIDGATYFYALSSCNADSRYCKIERHLIHMVMGGKELTITDIHPFYDEKNYMEKGAALYKGKDGSTIT